MKKVANKNYNPQERIELREWLGERLNLEKFSRQDVNARLRNEMHDS